LNGSPAIAAGVWFTEGGNVVHTPDDALFAMAELETEDDYAGIVAVPAPACPHAVVTHFGPIDPGVLGLADAREKAAPLIAAGYACVTEAYMGENPQATPDALDFRAAQLGWPSWETEVVHSQPLFGVHNAPLSTYTPWFDWKPGSWLYVVENLLS